MNRIVRTTDIWIFVFAVFAGWLLGGCKDTLPTEAPASQHARVKGPLDGIASTTYNLDAKAYGVVKRACWGCHAVQSPNGDYPAGVQISLTGGSGWGRIILPTGMSGDDMVTAINVDAAPANHPLTGGERDTLMEHFVLDHGLMGNGGTIPSTFSWDQETHQSGLTIPESGYQLHGYHSFAVERIDARANLHLQEYTESSARCCTGGTNPNNGRSAPLALEALWMSYYDATGTDSFTTSDDGTFYISPAGVPYNSRLKGAKWLKGYVQIRNRFFVGWDVMEDRRGSTTSTRRDVRDYVRFQVEGQSTRKAGFRLKKRGFTDPFETVGAWEDTLNNPGSSDLQWESPYRLHTSDGEGFNETLWDNTWYYIEVQVYDDNGYEHFVAKLWADNPAVNGSARLITTCGGKRAGTGKFGGFMWGWYERQGSGHYNRMAKWTVTADNMQGAGGGNPGGGGYELDR